MCGIAEMLGGGIPREEKLPDEEHEVHEGTELDFPAVVGALRVLAIPEAEVEANFNQVGDVVGSGVGGYGCRGDDGVNDSYWDGLLLLDGGSSSP